MTEYQEELSQFFGCYFHQDWNLDDHSWKDVVRRFLDESEQSAAHSIAEKITKLVDIVKSDDQLAETIQNFGCYYWPGSFAEMRVWLKSLSTALTGV